jgi:hypothetical protein
MLWVAAMVGDETTGCTTVAVAGGIGMENKVEGDSTDTEGVRPGRARPGALAR